MRRDRETARDAGEVEQEDPEVSTLRAERDSLKRDVETLAERLRETEGSLGWLLAQKVRQLIDRFAPKGSSRRGFLLRSLSSFRPYLQEGFRTTLRSRVGESRENIRLAFLRARSRPDDPPGLEEVLFLSGSFGAMERYRCVHAREQLALRGIRTTLRREVDDRTELAVAACDAVVLHRTPFSPKAARVVAAAERLRVPTLFDIDDLVFDPGVMERIDSIRWMDSAAAALFRESIERYRKTLALCDAALVPTEPLAEAVRALGKPAFVHRNAPSLELLQLSDAAARSRRPDPSRLVLGYASGSRTHNRDFLEASPALLRLFAEEPSAELHVIGYLDLGPEWKPFLPRVRKLEYVPWRRLPSVLATFDVNLAPLEHGNPFCEAKSELKWVEAAAVSVPTIASPTAPYRGAIRHGVDGFLAGAEEEWLEALRELTRDPARRASVGAAAKSSLLERYHPAVLGRALAAHLAALRGSRAAVEAAPAGR